MEQADDVDGVVCSEVFGLDGLGRVDGRSAFEAGGVGSAWDENVDFADRLDDLGHAWEVRLGGGVGLDFGIRVGFFKRCFRLGEDRFAALDDDDACDASLGERLGNCITDSRGLDAMSVAGLYCVVEEEVIPPAVMNKVLPFASNVLFDGETRS